MRKAVLRSDLMSRTGLADSSFSQVEEVMVGERLSLVTATKYYREESGSEVIAVVANVDIVFDRSAHKLYDLLLKDAPTFSSVCASLALYWSFVSYILCTGRRTPSLGRGYAASYYGFES